MSDNSNKTDIITYLSQLTEVSSAAKLISSTNTFPSWVFPLLEFLFTIEYDILVIYGSWVIRNVSGDMCTDSAS